MSRGAAQAQEIIKQTVVIRNQTVPVTSVTTAAGFGTVVVGDFPEGNILFLGALAYISLAGSGADANLIDTWNGDFSVGTNPTADVSLTGNEVDIIPSTATTVAVAEVSPRTRAANATQAIFDNTDGSLEVNLNVLIDAADIGDSQTVNLTANGEITLVYVILGDD
jgi:hypothetical protein